jgi:hypothetical protein
MVTTIPNPTLSRAFTVNPTVWGNRRNARVFHVGKAVEREEIKSLEDESHFWLRIVPVDHG